MRKKEVYLFFVLLVLSVFLYACSGQNSSRQNEIPADIESAGSLGECRSICASFLDEDFTTLHLCNEECKIRFENDSDRNSS